MKPSIALLLLCVASSTFGQDSAPPQASAVAPGCGPANGSFEVKSESKQHPVAAPQDGKAIVYFLQDDKYFKSRPRPTDRWGIDGQWVGATQANDYAYYYVDPGEHHLCVQWQTRIDLQSGHQTAVAHFRAVAGKSYYFRALDRDNRGIDEVKLGPADRDQAQLLMTIFGYSSSKPKD